MHNADIYQDVPYIATEVAALKSAGDLLDPHPFGVRPDFAVRWIRHLLVGLQVCHQRGMIHRDVKASNLFLQSTDLAQLGDFGLATLVDHAGQAAPHGPDVIRAPEMFTLNHGTRQSDIYSVGVTLYKLLAGRYPYSKARAPIAAPAGDYPDIRTLAPHVSRKLAARVRTAMAVSPANRYPTAEAMHTALVAPPPLSRIWERHDDHPEHFECWVEIAEAGRPLLSICVAENENDGFLIELDALAGTGYADSVRPRLTSTA